MKKFSFLMALIICLGCVLLTACGNDEPETTDTEPTVESVTNAPESTAESDDGNTGGGSGDGGSGDGGSGDGGNSTVVFGTVDESKDAYANDIYEGVAPKEIG